MEQSNWSAAMLSLQMLKYYCRLSKKRMKKRIKKLTHSRKFKRVITRLGLLILQLAPLTDLIMDCVC